jgi:hypothetical protein
VGCVASVSLEATCPTVAAFTATDPVVRYQVGDLDRAVAFYTGPLGFELAHRMGPSGMAARGQLHLLLSGSTSSGADMVGNR